MTSETLKKANELQSDVAACDGLLGAFEWDVWNPGLKTWVKESRRPCLIIRCDDCDGGTEDFTIPGVLQEDMIAKIKTYAQDIRKEAADELSRL